MKPYLDSVMIHRNLVSDISLGHSPHSAVSYDTARALAPLVAKCTSLRHLHIHLRYMLDDSGLSYLLNHAALRTPNLDTVTIEGPLVSRRQCSVIGSFLARIGGTSSNKTTTSATTTKTVTATTTSFASSPSVQQQQHAKNKVTSSSSSPRTSVPVAAISTRPAADPTTTRSSGSSSSCSSIHTVILKPTRTTTALTGTAAAAAAASNSAININSGSDGMMKQQMKNTAMMMKLKLVDPTHFQLIVDGFEKGRLQSLRLVTSPPMPLSVVSNSPCMILPSPTTLPPPTSQPPPVPPPVQSQKKQEKKKKTAPQAESKQVFSPKAPMSTPPRLLREQQQQESRSTAGRSSSLRFGETIHAHYHHQYRQDQQQHQTQRKPPPSCSQPQIGNNRSEATSATPPMRKLTPTSKTKITAGDQVDPTCTTLLTQQLQRIARIMRIRCCSSSSSAAGSSSPQPARVAGALPAPATFSPSSFVSPTLDVPTPPPSVSVNPSSAKPSLAGPPPLPPRPPPSPPPSPRVTVVDAVVSAAGRKVSSHQSTHHRNKRSQGHDNHNMQKEKENKKEQLEGSPVVLYEKKEHKKNEWLTSMITCPRPPPPPVLLDSDVTAAELVLVDKMTEEKNSRTKDDRTVRKQRHDTEMDASSAAVEPRRQYYTRPQKQQQRTTDPLGRGREDRVGTSNSINTIIINTHKKGSKPSSVAAATTRIDPADLLIFHNRQKQANLPAATATETVVHGHQQQQQHRSSSSNSIGLKIKKKLAERETKAEGKNTRTQKLTNGDCAKKKMEDTGMVISKQQQQQQQKTGSEKQRQEQRDQEKEEDERRDRIPPVMGNGVSTGKNMKKEKAKITTTTNYTKRNESAALYQHRDTREGEGQRGDTLQQPRNKEEKQKRTQTGDDGFDYGNKADRVEEEEDRSGAIATQWAATNGENGVNHQVSVQVNRLRGGMLTEYLQQQAEWAVGRQWRSRGSNEDETRLTGGKGNNARGDVANGRSDAVTGRSGVSTGVPEYRKKDTKGGARARRNTGHQSPAEAVGASGSTSSLQLLAGLTTGPSPLTTVCCGEHNTQLDYYFHSLRQQPRALPIPVATPPDPTAEEAEAEVAVSVSISPAAADVDVDEDDNRVVQQDGKKKCTKEQVMEAERSKKGRKHIRNKESNIVCPQRMKEEEEDGDQQSRLFGDDNNAKRCHRQHSNELEEGNDFIPCVRRNNIKTNQRGGSCDKRNDDEGEIKMGEGKEQESLLLPVKHHNSPPPNIGYHSYYYSPPTLNPLSVSHEQEVEGGDDALLSVEEEESAVLPLPSSPTPPPAVAVAVAVPAAAVTPVPPPLPFPASERKAAVVAAREGGNKWKNSVGASRGEEERVQPEAAGSGPASGRRVRVVLSSIPHSQLSQKSNEQHHQSRTTKPKRQYGYSHSSPSPRRPSTGDGPSSSATTCPLPPPLPRRPSCYPQQSHLTPNGTATTQHHHNHHHIEGHSGHTTARSASSRKKKKEREDEEQEQQEETMKHQSPSQQPSALLLLSYSSSSSSFSSSFSSASSSSSSSLSSCLPAGSGSDESMIEAVSPAPAEPQQQQYLSIGPQKTQSMNKSIEVRGKVPGRATSSFADDHTKSKIPSPPTSANAVAVAAVTAAAPSVTRTTRSSTFPTKTTPSDSTMTARHHHQPSVAATVPAGSRSETIGTTATGNGSGISETTISACRQGLRTVQKDLSELQNLVISTADEQRQHSMRYRQRLTDQLHHCLTHHILKDVVEAHYNAEEEEEMKERKVEKKKVEIAEEDHGHGHHHGCRSHNNSTSSLKSNVVSSIGQLQKTIEPMLLLLEVSQTASPSPSPSVSPPAHVVAADRRSPRPSGRARTSSSSFGCCAAKSSSSLSPQSSSPSPSPTPHTPTSHQ